MRHLIPTLLILFLSLVLACGCAKRKENLTAEDENSYRFTRNFSW